MIHPDLYNALKLINPDLGPESPIEEFWRTRPAGPFDRRSFWGILTINLMFARSAKKQKRIADWIQGWYERNTRAGKPFPPKAFVTKQAVVPVPNHN